MAQVALTQATYADLEAVPPHRVAEILHGVLYSHPRPSPRHAIASASLGSALLEPFQKGRGGPGGWIFMVEPEVHLNGDIVVPDSAGWRRERLSVLPETAFIETPPDWVCEILSPATERLDRNEKRAIYAAAGLAYLWLVDPRVRVLEAFRLVDRQWLLTATVAGDDDVAAEPFQTAPFPLSSLWPLDMPPDRAAMPKT